MEFIVLLALAIFVYLYRRNTGTNVYKYIVGQVQMGYEKFAPYSFKVVREKTVELGQEYSVKQYTMQVVIFTIMASVISYLYFYNVFVSIFYAAITIAIIPYLAYLRCSRVYNEYIFEQMQVYTTNVIMEFEISKSFVKALEGVYSSGVLEDPILSDVKVMIDMAYDNGSIDQSINYIDTKYNYYTTKNMHQLFLQITKEGSKDSGEALENMLSDIDMLVESVYRDRMDRQAFYKQFLQFGVILYFLVMILQFLLGVDSYLELISIWFMNLLVHAIIIFNSYFILSGTKYYNENVGAE